MSRLESLLPLLLAPSVFISAAGLLVLGAGTVYGRIADRIRAIHREMAAASGDLRAELRADRDILLLRARRTWLALVFLYGAVLTFVLASLALGASAFPRTAFLARPALVFLFGGVLLLGAAAAALVSEATRAFEILRRETKRADRAR